MANRKAELRTTLAPEDTSANQLIYTPENPHSAPSPEDIMTNFLKLSVNSLATIGGVTVAPAISNTPSTCIDTTMVAASTRENVVSTHPVGTP